MEGGTGSDPASEASDEQQKSSPGGKPSDDSENDQADSSPNDRIALEEYKIAGSEARYRDKMLFTSFYLSLVALAVLLQIVLGLFGDQQLLSVIVVSIVAAAGFVNLLWWSSATKQARNKAWGRREELEEKLSSIELNRYLAGDTMYDFANSDLKKSSSIIGKSSSDLVIGFAVVATLGWIGTAAGTTLMIWCDGSQSINYTIGGVVIAISIGIAFYVYNEGYCIRRK